MAIQNQKLNISFLWKGLFSLPFTETLVLLTLLFFSPAHAAEIRILSLNPSITEALFELGLGKNIVGTSSFSNFPEAAKKIPTVGSYLKPSIEKIVRLKPTHVLVFKEGDPSIAEALKKANLNYIVFESRTLQDFETLIQELGRIFNVTQKSEELLKLWKNQWNMLSNFPKVSKKIMIQVDHNPIFVAGGDTFLSKAFEKCGLKNAFENLDGYKKIQLESVFNRKPDVILLIGQLNETENYKYAKDFWQKNPITKNSSVLNGNADELSRLTSRLPKAIIKTCDEIKKL